MDPATAGALSSEVSVIINAYAHAIRPSIAYIMISTIFTSFLLVIVVALFYSSTDDSRKRPVFILNTIALLASLVAGIVTVHSQIALVISPFTGYNSGETFAWIILSTGTPWISEAILLLRLVAVTKTRSKLTIAMVLAAPVCLKVARFALLIRYLCIWQQHSKGQDNALKIATSMAHIDDGWLIKLNFLLELLDNAYMSGAFLLRLYNVGYSSGLRSSQGLLRTRLRTLFWITSTNFVFPVVFSICCIVIVSTTDNLIAAGVLDMLDLFTTTICTVLATVWVQSHEKAQTRQAPVNNLHLSERRMHETSSPPSIMSNIAFIPMKEVMPA